MEKKTLLLKYLLLIHGKLKSFVIMEREYGTFIVETLNCSVFLKLSFWRLILLMRRKVIIIYRLEAGLPSSIINWMNVIPASWFSRG